MKEIKVLISNWPTESVIISYIPLILSLVAILISSIPYWPKKPEVYGKLVSLTTAERGNFQYLDSQNNQKKIEGFLYTIKTPLTVLRKNLTIKNIMVYIKYKNSEIECEAILIRSNEVKHNFNGVDKILKIPSSKELMYLSILEKDTTKECYSTFIVDKADVSDVNALDFNEIKIKLIDLKDKTYNISFYKKDIDSKKMLYEEELWK